MKSHSSNLNRTDNLDGNDFRGSDSKSEFSLLEVQVNLEGNNILRSYRAQLFVE
jgi:hypothetical protein